MKHLKIDRQHFKALKTGTKKCEYRKVNKDSIEKGDTVIFRDTESDYIFGYAVVKSKNYVDPKEVLTKDDVDAPTKKFITNNYLEEKKILEFTFEKI